MKNLENLVFSSFKVMDLCVIKNAIVCVIVFGNINLIYVIRRSMNHCRKRKVLPSR